MELGLALFPALGGYLFLLACSLTRPRVQPLPGYHLVFACALAGVFFYAVSFLVAVGFDLGNARVVKAALAHATLGEQYGTVVSAAVLSVILAAVVAVLVDGCALVVERCASIMSGRVPREMANLRAAERAGRLREVLLHNAMSERGLVEVSLETGKSYVAFVQKIIIGQPQSADVLLVPVLSGYRHPETLSLHLTTNYFPIIEWQQAQGMTGDLPVGVPVSAIVSVRPFDLEVWSTFPDPSLAGPRADTA